MKHSFYVGIIGLAITSIAACGADTGGDAADGQTIAPQSTELAVTPRADSARVETQDTAAERQVGAEDSAERSSAAAQEARSEDDTNDILGKSCTAICTVINLSATSCPASIAGQGETTFLGGCGKACNKADGDASSKLPPGCAIYTCSHSGC
jgi:hypothetical protein